MSQVMKNNLYPVAKEALPYLLTTAALLLLSLALDFDFVASLFFFTALAILYIFRNPERTLQSFESASLLSPVDGKLLSIEELVDDEYALKIEIESSYTDVSFLRMPMQAEVLSCREHRGTRTAKENALFESTNEFAELVFSDAENSVKVVHRLTRSFAPLSIELHPSQKLLATTRYGVMLCGITTLYLPKNFRLSAQSGQHLSAGESLMGYFS